MLGGTVWLGSEVTAITAGRLLLSATSQSEATVTRVVFSARDAGGVAVDLATVQIADVKMGTQSQFVGLQSIPATIFAAPSQANNAGYVMGCIQPGTDFSLVVQNAKIGFTYSFGAVCEVICQVGQRGTLGRRGWLIRSARRRRCWI